MTKYKRFMAAVRHLQDYRSVHVHVHGGCYANFARESGTAEMIYMAGFGKFKTISVDYRTPSDHPYPAALDDAMTVWKAAVTMADPKNMAIFGSSAGGALTLSTENPPSFATLAVWSRRGHWQAAAAHDEFVGNALVARLRETAVEEQFDRVTALTKLAQSCLDGANEIELDPTLLSASDIRALVSAAIDAIKMTEVLTGGVSDRAANDAGLAEEAVALLRRLEAQKWESARGVGVVPQCNA
jgi:hypothetical protein